METFFDEILELWDDGPKGSGVCGFLSGFVVHDFVPTHPVEAVPGFGVISSILS